MKITAMIAAVAAFLYLLYHAAKRSSAPTSSQAPNISKGSYVDAHESPILVTPSTPTANATLQYVAPILRTGFPNASPSPVSVSDPSPVNPNSPSQIAAFNGDPAVIGYDSNGMALDVPPGVDYPGLQDYMYAETGFGG